MSIEFNCVRCRARLQIPEEVLGQKTQCPYCQEIQIVAPAVLTPARVQFLRLLQDTWAVFCARFSEFLVFGLVVIVAAILINIPFQIFGRLIGLLDQFPREINIVIIIVSVVFFVLAMICGLGLVVGSTRYALHLVRGGPQKLSLLIPRAGQIFNYLLQYLILLLLYSVFTVPALFLIRYAILLQEHVEDAQPMGTALLVCVVFFLLFFSMLVSARLGCGVAFLVDRNEGPIQSLLSSYAFSAGNTWVIFGNLFVFAIGGMCFTCCTCYIGGILLLPFMYCFWAIVYLSITGQSFPRPVTAGPPMQPPATPQSGLPPLDPLSGEVDGWPRSEPAKNE